MNTDPSKFELSAEFFRDLREAVGHETLFEQELQPTDEWIGKRAIALIEKNLVDSVTYMAKTLARDPENEPIEDSARMRIWITAKRLHEASPDKMNSQQFESWIFCLISLGYMMKSDEQKSSNETPGVPPPTQDGSSVSGVQLP